jgi:MFS family permease
VGFFTCYGSRNMGSSLAWRRPFVLLAAFAFLFAGFSLFWLPESPRWLAMRHREADVAKAWDVLGVDRADREKVENGHERALMATTNPGDLFGQPGAPFVMGPVPVTKKSGILDAFAPDVRARTILGVFVLGMQQMSGIDGILYVSLLSLRPKSKLIRV